jgi:hypothetical protein
LIEHGYFDKLSKSDADWTDLNEFFTGTQSGAMFFTKLHEVFSSSVHLSVTIFIFELLTSVFPLCSSFYFCLIFTTDFTDYHRYIFSVNLCVTIFIFALLSSVFQLLSFIFLLLSQFSPQISQIIHFVHENAALSFHRFIFSVNLCVTIFIFALLSSVFPLCSSFYFCLNFHHRYHRLFTSFMRTLRLVSTDLFSP